jgi:hypothetical protein
MAVTSWLIDKSACPPVREPEGGRVAPANPALNELRYSRGSPVRTWVAAHYTKETVGGTTVYNLTQPKSS